MCIPTMSAVCFGALDASWVQTEERAMRDKVHEIAILLYIGQVGRDDGRPTC
jgi:hypothetical protein